MIENNFNVVWLTGMSGSGKSTLALYIENFFKNNKYKVYLIDGDEIRDKDVKKLGFGRKDVLRNNLRIAELCLNLKDQGVNLVLVPVISPYKEVRRKVRSILGSSLHLVYVKTSIETLKERESFYNENNIKIKKIENIDNFNDLNGLISLIDVCDFVITISNTNAHIAGSLGKKTFLILPKGKGRLWYWISKKKRSIWYPKIEIIEQEETGNWKYVIKKLQKKVKEYLIE